MLPLHHGEPAPLNLSAWSSPEHSEKNFLKQNGYSIERCIGEGSYATVRLAHHNSHPCPLAVKVIKKAKAPADFMERFLPRELDILYKIKHPNIIGLHNVINLPLHVYIFMELAHCGDLLDYIKVTGALSDVAACRIFAQLVSALRYCHNQDIAHRDLKCENILLDEELNAKITDFGFARVCTDTNKRRVLSETYCGSSAYAAPEVLKGVPYNPKMYDIWSLGVILYIMVCGSMPFDDTNLSKMLNTMIHKQLSFPSRMSSRISPSCKSLICHMLQPDVTKRATLEQIRNTRWLEPHANDILQ